MENGKEVALDGNRTNQKGTLLPVSMPKKKGTFLERLLQLLTLFLGFCFIFSVVSVYMIRHYGANNSLVANLYPSLQPCADENPSLDRWIKPPSNLLHSMSDQELFWRATMAPRIKKYPFDRVPKIAFMFLTKGPMPLAPLWERFFKGHDGFYSIYVHSLPSFQADYPKTSVFYRRQVPSQMTEWGEISLCDAEKRLLSNALLDINNEWFVLLSESCIPLYNFSLVYKYISKSRHSFVSVFDDPGPDGRGRYNSRMAPEVNITEWQKGSQWFEVNRKLAISIVADTKFYAKFAEFCRQPCYGDEHYIPTMLTIQAADQLANRSITWVDWSKRGEAHPATFGAADVTEQLMKGFLENQNCTYNDEPSSICYLFARKFTPPTLEPLLLLAPKYLGY
ncbi:OLC1v1029169C1 [Oldenlandia corymbosa var. corymbosa]|uniref:OLC1v1029169C1 n=1 Tax=Oldenlandia corymbosa var. corymbosa TaxID=529605 RepID=A0AAV1CDR8_OLDCO|nr:OLC1v1029169C1 [Oldenlandia corymbosa var. corymbosa]